MTIHFPTPERQIYSRSPECVWELSGRFLEDGTPLWTCRQWKRGERAEYCRNVLKREPMQGESS